MESLLESFVEESLLESFIYGSERILRHS